MSEAVLEVEVEGEEIVDEAGEDESNSITYSISWYGADYTVDGLVKRVKEETFFIPPFQRHFVWSKRQASRFVESLLLGLPVPGIFVAKEPDSARHMVIDGQQRLKTLEGFYKNEFPKGGDFQLEDIDERWVGATYDTLQPEDRTRLDDSILHTTVFKQDEPKEEDTSIYHVFQRLNDGGTKLSPQEIRRCLDYGKFMQLLDELNKNAAWRGIYGKESPRLKDQEMILRFFALFENYQKYSRPMKDFLNSYSAAHKEIGDKQAEELRERFVKMIDYVKEALGRRAFRAQNAINVAIFDAVSVAVARLGNEGKLPDPKAFSSKYEELLKDADFVEAYTRATADEQRLGDRLRIAYESLAA